MESGFFALASFVVITTFTPGPNNISSASMGIFYGYKSTLRYLSGIFTGFFLIMLLCGLIAATLIRLFPSVETVLRIIGALYILWLAYHVFRTSYTFDEKDSRVLGFVRGFLLQLLNPKVIIYGFTVYATFLAQVSRPLHLILSALSLAGVAFCAVSTWTLLGAAIRIHLNRPYLKRYLNLALALLLVYTAVELSGILDLIFS